MVTLGSAKPPCAGPNPARASKLVASKFVQREVWVVSSSVERYTDNVEVDSSILSRPTKALKDGAVPPLIFLCIFLPTSSDLKLISYTYLRNLSS